LFSDKTGKDENLLLYFATNLCEGKIMKTQTPAKIVPMERGKTMAQVSSVIRDQQRGIIRTRVTTGDCCKK